MPDKIVITHLDLDPTTKNNKEQMLLPLMPKKTIPTPSHSTWKVYL